jgi:hypothetical protein
MTKPNDAGRDSGSSDCSSCRDCGRECNDMYWYGVNGAKLSKPRCQECHRRKVNAKSPENEEGVLLIQGCRQKVYGKHKRGIYEYREEK